MENNAQRDSASITIPPPVFFVACLASGLLLEYLFPVTRVRVSPILLGVVGGAIMLVSGCFALGSFILFIRNKVSVNTSKAATKIVTGGVYRFSRNPMYLSMLLLLAGIAVLMSSLWLIFAVPVLYVLLLYKAVKPEERYLAQKFGKEYGAYSARVRRWI